MKKIRIFLPNFETSPATIPLGEFKAVKLSREEAATFSGAEVKTFEDLLEKYGANNQLRPGEYYNGYLAVFYWWRHIEVILMRGKIRRLSPVLDEIAKLSKKIHDLKWECVKAEGEQGDFNYVWIVNDSCFAKQVLDEQKRGNSDYEALDAAAIDKALKSKIVAALPKEGKTIELTDGENLVLKDYLGEYYNKFFVETS